MKIEINFSNKVFYALMTLIVIVLLGAGVFAVSGVSHTMTELPAGICTSSNCDFTNNIDLNQNKILDVAEVQVDMIKADEIMFGSAAYANWYQTSNVPGVGQGGLKTDGHVEVAGAIAADNFYYLDGTPVSGGSGGTSGGGYWKSFSGPYSSGITYEGGVVMANSSSPFVGVVDKDTNGAQLWLGTATGASTLSSTKKLKVYADNNLQTPAMEISGSQVDVKGDLCISGDCKSSWPSGGGVQDVKWVMIVGGTRGIDSCASGYTCMFVVTESGGYQNPSTWGGDLGISGCGKYLSDGNDWAFCVKK